MRRVVIMVNKIALALFAAMAVALMSFPSYAALVPMSWGFPALVQNQSLTSFENNFAFSKDFESSDISFPTVSADSIIGVSAFPTVVQTSNITNLLSQCKFMNQQQSMQFAYPWISIGFSPVPSMGFL
jgi:predicted small integral membrane protein